MGALCKRCSAKRMGSTRTKSITHSQTRTSSKKVLLCMWWDTEGVVYWELLPQGQTITAEVYCQQLDRLADALAEKRPHRQQQIFLHDNARPHTARLTQQKLRQLRWDVLDHPPYSPDLAPTDYKAFRSLQHWLNGKEFATQEEVENRFKNGWIPSQQVSGLKGLRICLDAGKKWLNMKAITSQMNKFTVYYKNKDLEFLDQNFLNSLIYS